MVENIPEERGRTGTGAGTGSQVGRFHCREEENACATASLMPVTNHEVQNVHTWTKPGKHPTIIAPIDKFPYLKPLNRPWRHRDLDARADCYHMAARRVRGPNPARGYII